MRILMKKTLFLLTVFLVPAYAYADITCIKTSQTTQHCTGYATNDEYSDFVLEVDENGTPQLEGRISGEYVSSYSLTGELLESVFKGLLQSGNKKQNNIDDDGAYIFEDEGIFAEDAFAE